MDNAARALIIAATTILGVLLFGIMIYMLRAAAKVDEQYENNQSLLSLELQNSKFEYYNNNHNTIMDIISVCNLAYDNNVKYSYDKTKSVTIKIKIGDSYYMIPGGINLTPNDTSKVDNYSKNRIWKTNSTWNNVEKVISIYDLANKTLEELELTGVPNQTKTEHKYDKLTKTYHGTITYNEDKDGTIFSGKVKNNATVYKYIFKCDYVDPVGANPRNFIRYGPTGKIQEMYFEAYAVTDAMNELYWNPDWE